LKNKTSGEDQEKNVELSRGRGGRLPEKKYQNGNAGEFHRRKKKSSVGDVEMGFSGGGRNMLGLVKVWRPDTWTGGRGRILP